MMESEKARLAGHASSPWDNMTSPPKGDDLSASRNEQDSARDTYDVGKYAYSGEASTMTMSLSKLSKLERAVGIYEQYLFDKKKLPVVDIDFIQSVGGENYVKMLLGLSLAERYSELELVQTYRDNDGSMGPREKMALEYLAEKAGKRVDAFVKDRLQYYAETQKAAVDIAYNQLQTQDYFDPGNLPLSDYIAIASFNANEVELQACKRIYLNNRSMVVLHLSGHRKVESDSQSRIINHSVRYLCAEKSCSESELLEKYQRLNKCVFEPSKKDHEKTKERAREEVRRIPEEDIEGLVRGLGNRYGKKNDNEVDTIRAIDSFFKGLFGLESSGIETKINKTRTGNNFGLYDDREKRVYIYIEKIKQAVLENNQKDNKDLIKKQLLAEIVKIMAHEFKHVDQVTNGVKGTGSLSDMYIINKAAYIPSDGRLNEYERQLMEREADWYSYYFKKRFLKIYKRLIGV